MTKGKAFALAFLLGGAVVVAEPQGYRTFDSKGKPTGWVEPNRFVPGRWESYDRTYKKTGTIEENRRGDKPITK